MEDNRPTHVHLLVRGPVVLLLTILFAASIAMFTLGFIWIGVAFFAITIAITLLKVEVVNIHDGKNE